MRATLLRKSWSLPFAVLALGMPAHAQDRSQDVATAPFNYAPAWNGFYVGGGIGMATLNNRVINSGGGAVTSVDGAGGQGVLAAIYGGVDYQVMPKALVGALIEGTYSNAQSQATASLTGASATISTNPNWGFAAMLRAGILASPNTLLYFTGGYAGQNFRTSGNAFAGSQSASFARDDWFNGFAFGTGVEAQLAGPWTTKLEYRYTQFENRTLSATSTSYSPTFHTIRAGLTYRFGGLGEAPQDSRPTASTQPNIDWTGIYVGVAGGGSVLLNRLNASFGGAQASMTDSGQALLGAAFGGYDWQCGDSAVIGFMGDTTWTGPQSAASLNGSGGGVAITSRTSFAWSALGRVGFLPTRSTLLYAVAGYTGAYISTTGNAFAGGASATLQRDDYVNGWTVGPGIETNVFGGWSTRLEYRYSQFEDKQIVAGASVQPTLHTIRAGLSYKFGPGPK